MQLAVLETLSFKSIGKSILLTMIMLLFTTHSVGIYWGDSAYTSKTYKKAEKFTLSHTYAEAGCSDVLITYGNLYPYCGEYYRQIVTVVN